VKFREILEASSAARNQSRVIVALDVVGPLDRRVETARGILARVRSDVAAVKVNMHLLLPFGVLGLRDLFEDCRSNGIPVIADVKLNDIEATNREAVGTLFSSGIDAVIANPFVGFREALSGVFKVADEMEKGVILLVYMSHAGAREGYGAKLASGKPMYSVFAERAKRWSADGVVVSAKSSSVLREVRKIIGGEQLILSPGVGAQGGEARKALRAGSDYVIVGRSITEADDPGRAAEEVRKESSLL
jgi:orotidine-5'-phosphate decarboxylase